MGAGGSRSHHAPGSGTAGRLEATLKELAPRTRCSRCRNWRGSLGHADRSFLSLLSTGYIYDLPIVLSSSPRSLKRGTQ